MYFHTRLAVYLNLIIILKKITPTLNSSHAIWTTLFRKIISKQNIILICWKKSNSNPNLWINLYIYFQKIKIFVRLVYKLPKFLVNNTSSTSFYLDLNPLINIISCIPIIIWYHAFRGKLGSDMLTINEYIKPFII